jgi:hypothetical protein
MAKLSFEELKKLFRKNSDSDAFLIESSYNRIRDHIEGGASFVMITADRHERSGKENKSKYQQLKQDYKTAGFPFTEVKGGFKETTKIVTDPETGETKQVALEEPAHVTESTLLVTAHKRGDVEREVLNPSEQLFSFTTEVAKKYNQEAFIFGESAESKSGRVFKDIRAYDNDGNFIKENWAGPWNSVETVKGDSEFWSRIKGKHFQLKEQKKKTSQPRSWIEAMKKSRSGETW